MVQAPVYCRGPYRNNPERGHAPCRIADPTGAFELITRGQENKYVGYDAKPAGAIVISVVGEARMYRKGENVTLTVRPDEVRIVDRHVRDRWVSRLRNRCSSGLKRWSCPPGPASDERIMVACMHYATTPAKLDELARMAGDAVRA